MRVGVTERRQERLAFEESALTNMLFWDNKPDFFIANGRIFTDARTYEDENEHETRYRVNLIRARVDTAVAKTLAAQVGFQVRPPSDSIEARGNAELSNRVFDHIRTLTGFKEAHRLATRWAAICGSSFIRCYWDPLVGDPKRYYLLDKQSRTTVPERFMTADQRREKEAAGLFEDYATGDFACSVCSPFGFFFDTASRDAGMAGCQWAAESHFVDIDMVAERFDVDANDIQPIEDDSGLANYEEAIAFMTNDNGLGIHNYARPEEKRGKRTRLVEMWQRPSKKYPRGLRLCWVPGLLLNADNTDNPHAADRTGWSHLPWVKVDWKRHPGRFWGVSLVEDMLIPQYYLNRTRSSIQSFVEAHGQPATYVGKNSGINTDKMTSQVGRIYTISENSPIGVKVGPTPQMPVEVIQAAGAAEADLNKIASQSEMEASKLPGQIRSGAGMREANASANAGLSDPAFCAAEAVRDAGRIFLAVAKLFVDEPRVAVYLGEDNKFAFKSWSGMNIINDVVITSEPDVSQTQSSSSQEMYDALNAGVFNPQLTREQQTLILKNLHFKSSAEWYSRALQAERNAEHCIREMIDDPLKFGDQGYPAFEWQDHEAEINTLVAFMYSGEFRDLGKKGQMGLRSQALITAYWQQHVQFKQAAMIQQIQIEAALKGTPGQKGQASQPATSNAA